MTFTEKIEKIITQLQRGIITQREAVQKIAEIHFDILDNYDG